MTTADLEQQVASIADFLRDTAETVGHPDILERLVTPLRTTMEDLAALPRSDDFWAEQANDRSTIFKLDEYARRRIDRDPNDRRASRTLVALALRYGANDGGLPYLTAEVAADSEAVGDAVIVAHWIWSEVGLDTAQELRRTLSAADPVALAGLAENHQGWVGVAARVALDVMAGASLYEAYARRC
ncbi:hypothetical protein Pth03_76670 [Planotetraspora thailandica]|uniref:Uncharacterized protein n=1 Tax=Planotetraspora thailandica TaxID=487172 RepID=A0A8J4DER3_9ACTN|nr:hypothetical protein [Planotetraspora thailandica]GII59278.1 hypothetical protein Pth03_76670 [Planotetraspora thailandica]